MKKTVIKTGCWSANKINIDVRVKNALMLLMMYSLVNVEIGNDKLGEGRKYFCS